MKNLLEEITISILACIALAGCVATGSMMPKSNGDNHYSVDVLDTTTETVTTNTVVDDLSAPVGKVNISHPNHINHVGQRNGHKDNHMFAGSFNNGFHGISKAPMSHSKNFNGHNTNSPNGLVSPSNANNGRHNANGHNGHGNKGNANHAN